ncbi:MAG: LPXTG cell wall anchor domain-containing protein [Actinomycetaceae bacterium]|nr:LPXTG cell wall anchor domain-containing protein [Actinomycetaceae bacterium]
MDTSRKEHRLGYYLLAIAVVCGFMALTLLPAQADTNVPTERANVEAPVLTPPKYEKNDPDLIDGVDDIVKVGDSAKISFENLPEDVDFIRFGEPVDPRIKDSKYQVMTKTFTPANPVKPNQSFTYTVPCWADTSADASDTKIVYINAFIKDSDAALTFIVDIHPVKATGDSAKKCQGNATTAPPADPNYDQYQRNGKKPGSSDTTPEQPPVAQDPVLTVAPAAAKQKENVKITAQKISVDAGRVELLLADSTGTPVRHFKNFEPHGLQSLVYNWTVDCGVAPGDYTVHMQVYDKKNTVMGATQQAVQVQKGACDAAAPDSGSKPNTDSKPDQGTKPNTDPTPDQDSKPNTDDQDKEPLVDIRDKHGKAISELSRGQEFSIVINNAKNVESAEFAFHSNVVDLGTSAPRPIRDQIVHKATVPCEATFGPHTITSVLNLRKGDPLTIQKRVTVKGSVCKKKATLTETGTTGVLSSGTHSAPAGQGSVLAKTGSSSQILAMLALAFAASGIFLITRRKVAV